MTKQKFGLTVQKEENFSDWYIQVVTRGELLDYYDIKGCYVIRPNAYYIWKQIQAWFTKEIEKLGVQECYFPILIPASSLEKEKNHIDDFAVEVAWITKCGKEDLHEPVAIRPTSETVMYPSYAKWIKSHRDLPLKLNQWCNVLRWEIKGTVPFIRGKEFLWQEGHTAYLKKEEADKEVLQILDLYHRIYRDLLAVPTIKGIKSENEKFAGSDYTTTIETFIPGSGKSVQAATSHSLGTNFSKIFDIKVQTDDDSSNFTHVYQNSWGFTTRSIGVATMIHSDNKGVVLPPRVAIIQAVIIPCGINSKISEEDAKLVYKKISELEKDLQENGIRTYIDDRKNVSPGYKFNHWELRGIPIGIEIGLRDLRNDEACVYKRHSGEKVNVKLDCFSKSMIQMLNDIHDELYAKASKEMESRIVYVNNYDEFILELENRNLTMIPWCEQLACEEEIKKRSTITNEHGVVVATGAKSLCIPFESKECVNQKCIICSGVVKRYTLFGRSY